MTDHDRLRRADAVEANWPDLAAYIREMAGEPEDVLLIPSGQAEIVCLGQLVNEIHDDDDGEYE